MTKPTLKLLKPVPTQQSAVDVGARVIALRRQLLRMAVRYVREGKEITRGDRLRKASNLSGIPLCLIDCEEQK